MLRSLYLRGPRWGSFGFWAGADPEDICAELTGVASGFWSDQVGQCARVIQRRIDSFVVLVQCATLVFSVWQTLLVANVLIVHILTNRIDRALAAPDQKSVSPCINGRLH